MFSKPRHLITAALTLASVSGLNRPQQSTTLALRDGAPDRPPQTKPRRRLKRGRTAKASVTTWNPSQRQRRKSDRQRHPHGF